MTLVVLFCTQILRLHIILPCVAGIGGKVNNGSSTSRITAVGELDPVFRTAAHVRSAKASFDSDKVLGSTSVVDVPDTDTFTVPICNKFDVLSPLEELQDINHSGSSEVQSYNSNHSQVDTPTTHNEVSTPASVHPIFISMLGTTWWPVWLYSINRFSSIQGPRGYLAKCPGYGPSQSSHKV